LIKAACSVLTRNFTFEEWKAHFGEIPYRRVCENLPPHPSLLKEAERRARSGDVNGAVAIIKQDIYLRDTLKMEPKKWAMEQAVKGAAVLLVQQGVDSARKGAIEQAIESFSKAQKLDPTIKISAGNWNDLAWHAAIRNQASLVIEAINNALDLAPNNGGFRDTRGVIRALTGDFKGAIEDFEYYVDWGPRNGRSQSAIGKRVKWIEKLKADENPFDANTLNGLIDNVIVVED
jgi:tetratricopeptide (TPR) repeat protein